MANQPIADMPKFQAPARPDNVDLVPAEAPNAFNTQFKSLRAELDTLSNVVQQLSNALNGINQTLNSLQTATNMLSTSATTASTSANSTLSTVTNLPLPTN